MEVWHSLLPVVILLVQVFSDCLAKFAVTPSSVTIEDGLEQEAMFRCRHERTDTHIINWLINRTMIQQYPDVLTSSFRDINDNLVQTLTIPAIPRYNESEVVCIAIFLDGSPHEETPSAALIISVTFPTTLMPAAIATAPPAPTTAPPITTLPSPHTPSTSTTSFLHTQPTANFTINPTSQNKTVEQRIAVFHCQHRSCDAITWIVSNLGTNNVTNTRLNGGGFNSSLTIETRLDLSGSTLQCVCLFNDNTPLEHSAPATLLVQGIRRKVNNTVHERNYSSNAITTRWTPSPSLNLTDIYPDIVYDVHLLRITCGKNVSISQKSVSGSSATWSSLDLTHIYEIVIAAQNNVPDAVNGPTVNIEESFISLNKLTLLELARNSQVTMTISDPIPSYFTLILNSINEYGYSLVTNISVTRNREMVTMQIEPEVPNKLLLNASVMAYGCEFHTITINELSTYEIQNITASSPLPGQIRVTGDYVDGSTATGVLLIVYSLTNDSDVLEDVQYMFEEKTESNISIDVTGLSSNEYSLSVFALEDGLPFPRVVALPKNVTVAANSDRETRSKRQTSTQYKLTRSSTAVCVHCTFLDDSTNGCVVVLHQRISRLNSSGLVNIKESHRFNRSGDTAYGCVEGVDLKHYQIGVIGGQVTSPTMMLDGKRTLKPQAILGTIFGVVVVCLIAVLAAMVILVRKFFRQQFKHGVLEAGLIGDFRVQFDRSLRAVRIRRTSADSNEYVVATKKEDISWRSEEEHSLVAPPLPPILDTTPFGDLLLDAQPMSRSLDHEHLSPSQEVDPSSPDHTTPDNDTSDPTYAQPLLPKSSKPVCPPVTERVVYDDIDKFQNKESMLYALTSFKSSSNPKPVDDFFQVMYSDIQPHSKGETESQNVRFDPESSEQATREPPPPFILEQLHSYLLPMASKWQFLGKALSLDEDRLDKIFTNNETDEARLRVMLEYYMMRSDLKHNWEEIKAAEEKVKEGSTDNMVTAETKPESDHLKPATAYTMSQVNQSAECIEIHDGVDKSENGIGTKCVGATSVKNHEDSCRHMGNCPLNSITESMLHVPSVFVNCEDPAVADDDFDSDLALPNAPGTESTHSHFSRGQCTLKVTKDRARDHTVQADTVSGDFDSVLSPHIPGSSQAPACYHTNHSCSLFPFVTNEDRDEEPCTNQVTPRAHDDHQESSQDLTEYSVVMMRQLEIGKQRSSKASLEYESSETDRLLISDEGRKSSGKQSANSTTENNRPFQKAVMQESNFIPTQAARQAACVPMTSSELGMICNPLLTGSRQTDEHLCSKVSHCQGNSTQTEHSCKPFTCSRVLCTPTGTAHHISSLKSKERPK